MEMNSVPLTEYLKEDFYRGIVTGYNDAFFIDSEIRDKLIRKHPSSRQVIMPLILGRDIRKWRAVQEDRFLIFTRRGIDIDGYPGIKKYLEQFRKDLEPRPRDWPKNKEWPGRKPGSYKWFEIQDDIAYYKEFSKPKILYQEIATYQAFAYDSTRALVNAKVFLIPTDDLFLLGVLNSKPAWEYLTATCSKLVGGALAMQSVYLKKLPIPRATADDKAKVSALVKKCLASPDGSCEKYESEISSIVSKLYGVL